MTATRTQAMRFAMAGVAGLGVDVAVLYCALALGAHPYLGRALSFLAAVYCTWQLNRRFTFSANAHVGAGAALCARSAWSEWWAYLTAMLGGGAVNYAVYVGALAVLPAHPLTPLAGVCAGSLAGMTANFTTAKFLVFRRH